MKTKSALALGGALVLVMGLSGAAMAHGKMGKGQRGEGRAQMIEQLDTNGDGAITRAEVEAAATARFAEADTNGDGFLSAEEMAAFGEGRNADRMAKRAERAMKRLDDNEDGQISAEELAAHNPADRLFDRLDADEDGTISAEELAEMKDRRGHGKRGGDRGHGKRGGDHGGDRDTN